MIFVEQQFGYKYIFNFEEFYVTAFYQGSGLKEFVFGECYSLSVRYRESFGTRYYEIVDLSEKRFHHTYLSLRDFFFDWKEITFLSDKIRDAHL